MITFKDIFESNLEFDDWQDERNKLEHAVDELEAKLKKFPTLADGRVSDEVRVSNEYIQAQKEFNVKFKELQNFNKNSPKEFKKKDMKLRRGY
jgi:predicted  nucleic acid-binding Zn-ribbon protein